MMLFHWKYLYEKTGQRVGVGTYSLQFAQPAPGGRGRQGRRRDLREQRHADQDRDRRRSSLASFLEMAGDLGLILNAIGMAVAFTILLVTANTMSMAIRERRTEIAVLKTLGYPSALVLALVLGEALVIGLLGSGLGVGLMASCSSPTWDRFRACSGSAAELQPALAGGHVRLRRGDRAARRAWRRRSARIARTSRRC